MNSLVSKTLEAVKSAEVLSWSDEQIEELLVPLELYLLDNEVDLESLKNLLLLLTDSNAKKLLYNRSAASLLLESEWLRLLEESALSFLPPNSLISRVSLDTSGSPLSDYFRDPKEARVRMKEYSGLDLLGLNGVAIAGDAALACWLKNCREQHLDRVIYVIGKEQRVLQLLRTSELPLVKETEYNNQDYFNFSSTPKIIQYHRDLGIVTLLFYRSGLSQVQEAVLPIHQAWSIGSDLVMTTSALSSYISGNVEGKKRADLFNTYGC